MTDLLRRHYRKVLLGILLLHIFTHLPFLSLPPCSIHVWRQCNTLAVARNFFEEDNNILQPRVDRRYDSDGVTGMQFPAYEWGLAQVYRVTGEQFFIQRAYSLLISSAAIVFTFIFFYRFRGDPFLGLCAAWFLCWSSEWFYHSINALPDLLAFCAGMGALAVYAGWTHRKTTLQFSVTILLLTLSGLVKIQYGIFGGIIAALAVQQHHRNLMSKKNFIHWTIAGLSSFAIVCCWYLYANKLIQTSGLYDYVLQWRPVTNTQEAIAIISKNIISDLPELLFNYAGTILLVIGLISLFRKDNRKKWVALPAFVLFIIWYVLMLEQMKVHQYYLLPLLMLAIFPFLNGIKWMLDNKRTAFVWILFAAMPVLAMIRILPARWMKDDLGIPAAFADNNYRQQLINAVPDQESVITIPDESGCIWLYFLHKKGFSYTDETLFTTKNDQGEIIFDEYKRRGAQWVYMPTGYLTGKGIANHPGLTPVTSIGGIDLFKISQP